MNKDSRITIGIALLYFINGMVNLFGPARTFAPLVFIDSFLLALLALVFMILPPFRKPHLVFVLFVVHFTVLGCLNTKLIQGVYIDIGNQVLFLVLCLGLYAYSIWQATVLRMLLLVPAILFVITFAMGYLGVPALVITATAVFSALWQVYLLARPDIAQQLSPFVRRFYLLIILTVFFDAVYQAFVRLNFS